MSKVRVYEVARDLGMDNKALVALFQSVGITDVRNHMSAVAPEQVERVKRHLEKQSSQKVVEERIRPTVVKRRAVKKPAAVRAPVEAPSSPAAAETAEPPAPPAPQPPVEAPEVTEPVAVAPPPPDPEPAAAPEPAVAYAEGPVAPSEPSLAPAPEPSSPAAAPPSAPIQEAVVEPPAPGAAAVASVVEEKPAPERAPVVEAASPSAVATATPAPAPEPSFPARSPRGAPAARNADRTTSSPSPALRPSSPPKTGVEVWEGRPGVPMPQAPRGAPTPRRVQYDAKAGTAGGVGQRHRGGPMGPGRMGRGGRHRGIGSLSSKRSGGQPVTQERSAHKKIVKIEESIGLQGLGAKMGIKATDVLMKLMQLGMTGVNINSTLDAETAKIVANEFGWEVEDVAVSEEAAIEAAQGLEAEEGEEGLEARPPVVTVMGHVDHGKTSLLDRLRKSNVVSSEAGGITQHIGAYSVETPRGRLTFLDTPGHEAFTQMRARGAQATDVVVLVVAADDGVMPQTKEAINHARAANVPIVVAVNKIDKEDAQPERVRRELSEVSLVPEEWGGDTLFCEVSATTGQGIDQLLENIALQAELLDLKANPSKPASGLVVEAQLDRGRGPVATMLVTEGTLQRGDVILAGSAWGKVRAMIDDRGRNIASAGPSIPVSIIGLNDVPSAGDPVHVVKDPKKAQEIADSRKTKERRSLIPTTAKVSLEELARAMSEGQQLELKVIVKADVQGSVEAVTESLQRLTTEKVKVTVVHSAVGAITEGDVNLALAAKAIIIGFNVRPAGKATGLAQKEEVEIRQYGVIYDVVEDVKKAMEGLLAPTYVEHSIGKAEIRKTFKVSKAGWVAGCMVIQGAIRRNASVRLMRDGSVLWEGKLSNLKRFKEDVREVKEGFDCGMALDGYSDIKEGDILEAFEVEEVRQTL